MMNQKTEPKQFSPSIFTMKGISKKAVEEHMKLYQGYVNKYNEINEKLLKLTEEDLTKANATYSQIRELKVALTFAWGGVFNHEMYFSILGGTGGEPSGELKEQIIKDFGSFDAYKKEMKALAISARGWVWTAWNEKEGKFINYIGDSHNTYGIWGVHPVVTLDTYEHAYFMDYGANRGAYVDAFFDNINWQVVEHGAGLTCECCSDEPDCCGKKE